LEYEYTLWQNGEFIGRIIPQKKQDEYGYRPSVSIAGHLVPVVVGRPAQSIWQFRSAHLPGRPFIQMPDTDLVLDPEYAPEDGGYSSEMPTEGARAEDVYEIRKDKHTMEIDQLHLMRIVMRNRELAVEMINQLGLPGDVREVWQVAGWREPEASIGPSMVVRRW
jgi:hypothetical protein